MERTKIMDEFATEFEFDLPKGYVDNAGTLHKHGVMRLATAADEILPLRDPRVVQNPGYLTIILLSRVIVSLGTVQKMDPRIVEKFFSADLVFLQSMYQQINSAEPLKNISVCPACGHEYEQPINFTSAE
ncbi:MAG: phage tail assembly protein [Oscillospiraceae bacterium]